MDAEARALVGLRGTAVADKLLEYEREGTAGSVLTLLSTRLNDQDVSLKEKTSIMVALADAALEPRVRPVVLHSLHQLGETFEAHLVDKEEGRKQFGTALGPLHELILVTLLRASGYELGAADVLELVRGDAVIARQLALQCLQVKAYEPELAEAVASLLCDFTEPQTYFQAVSGSETQEHDVGSFTVHIDALLQSLTGTDMLARVVTNMHSKLSLVRWSSGGYEGNAAAMPPPLGVAHARLVDHTMRMISNVYTFASPKDTVMFAQHVAVATPLLSTHLVPLLGRLQHTLEAWTIECSTDTAPELVAARQALFRTCKVAATLLYHALKAAKDIRAKPGSLCRVLTSGVAHSHPMILAAVLQVAGNADILVPLVTGDPKPVADLLIENNMEALAATLGKGRHSAVRAALLGGAIAPISRQNTTFAKILELLQETDKEKVEPEEKEPEKEEKEDPAAAKAQASPKPKPKPKPKPEADPVPQKRVGGGFMAPAKPAPAPAPARKPKSSSSSSSSQGSGTTHTGDLPRIGGAGRAGDQMGMTHSATAAAASASFPAGIGSTATGGAAGVKPGDPVLDNFRCALSGHLLKTPVWSPYGHVFEQETIEKILDESGTCPLTKKWLTKDQLSADPDLAKQIHQYRLQRNMAKKKRRKQKEKERGKQAGGLDIYDFE